MFGRTFLGFGIAVAALALPLAQQASAITGNVAPHGIASQSSTGFGGVASRGIDGNTNTLYGGNSVTHTDPSAANAFWQVNLGATDTIEAVRFFNRGDCCGGRLGNFRLSVLDAGGSEVFGQDFPGAIPQGGNVLVPTGSVSGKTVRLQFNGLGVIPGETFMSLPEVEVYAANANHVNLGRSPGSVASQSSTGFGGTADRAIDGNISGNYGENSVTHTNGEANAFWQVKVAESSYMESIRIFNRADCCGGRLGNFRVSVLDESNVEVFGQDVAGAVPQGGNIRIQLPYATEGQTVKVQFNGLGAVPAESFLSLAEVQVLGGTFKNLARNPFAVASQSSTDFGGDAARAIDGNTDGNYGGNSVTHTGNQTNAFWQVDLGDNYSIDEVLLFNRADCCGGRLGNFRVSLLDGGLEVFGSNFLGQVAQGGQFPVDFGGRVGDTIRVQFLGNSGIPGENFLSLAEVMVFGAEVPEPASAALGLMGVLALGLRRRRAA